MVGVSTVTAGRHSTGDLTIVPQIRPLLLLVARNCGRGRQEEHRPWMCAPVYIRCMCMNRTRSRSVCELSRFPSFRQRNRTARKCYCYKRLGERFGLSGKIDVSAIGRNSDTNRISLILRYGVFCAKHLIQVTPSVAFTFANARFIISRKTDVPSRLHILSSVNRKNCRWRIPCRFLRDSHCVSIHLSLRTTVLDE